MVYSRTEAVARANATTRNQVGFCQGQVTIWFGVSPVGDFDGNGRANAVDGWKSEPDKYKHPGDRHAPAGTPVAWSGGSTGDGHRAISLGKLHHDGVTWIRSTDAGGAGITTDVPLVWVEQNWPGHTYLGWSESMNGVLIPDDTKPTPAPKPKPAPKTKGPQVDTALDALKQAKGTGYRGKMIQRALDALKHIKPFNR